MSILAALDIDKSFGPKILLSKASFTLDEGERVGVVGRNGAGKSTLAKILARVEPSDGGSIALRRGARITFLAQEPDLDPTLSVRSIVEQGLSAWLVAHKAHEELTARIAQGEISDALLADQLASSAEVERLGGWDRAHEVERVIQHLGIGDLIDRPVGQLSGGQRRRAALAQALVDAPDILILDEPTNHLDADTIDWLERHLAEAFRGAVLFVTHDRWLLDRIAHRTIEVDHGSVYAYDGGYADYLEAKAERLAQAERAEQNRQNFLRTELEWLRRQPKARGTKQKARIERAETAKAATYVQTEQRIELSAQVSDAGRSVLDIRGLDVSNGSRTLVRDFTLAMTMRERLGILGPNGAGKTTLLRAILASAKANSDGPQTFELGGGLKAQGHITLGRRVRVGYLDQERAGLDPDASVFDCVARAVPSVDKERIDPRSYLERFMFDVQAQRKKVAALSGGERARLALARLLASSANLLLLDEPSNDLDTDTLSALEDFLSTYEGSLLVVTHDRYLLDRVTTGMLAFEENGRVTRYAGAYQAYAAARAQEAEDRQRERSRSLAPKAPAEKPKPAGLSKNDQRELDGIMDRIDEAEQAVATIEAELSDPSLYAPQADPAIAASVRTRLEQARAQAAALTARWEQLESKKLS
jgi:ATP-binding cassette subfamily F protein uup